MEVIGIQELGGMTNAIAEGVRAAQKLSMQISGMQRQPVDISNYVMGIKCGGIRCDQRSGIELCHRLCGR